MGACHSGLVDSGDEAAGPVLQERPRDWQEGSRMVSLELVRIMRVLGGIERELFHCRPDLAHRLRNIIEQLGDLDVEIEYFHSESEYFQSDSD